MTDSSVDDLHLRLKDWINALRANVPFSELVSERNQSIHHPSIRKSVMSVIALLLEQSRGSPWIEEMALVAADALEYTLWRFGGLEVCLYASNTPLSRCTYGCAVIMTVTICRAMHASTNNLKKPCQRNMSKCAVSGSPDSMQFQHMMLIRPHSEKTSLIWWLRNEQTPQCWPP